MSYDRQEVLKRNSLFSDTLFNVGNKTHRNVLLNCDHGLMIVNRFDCNHEQVGHSQWLLDHGNVSTVESLYCYDLIKEITDPTIFDVGANIGTFTTWLARAFPQGKIYSFEPQHAVFQQLAGNVAINNLYNVYTYNMGLGSVNEYVTFNEPDYFSNCDFGTFTLKDQRHVPRTSNAVVIEVRTLDSFVELHQIARVDLLKIDVEGMDVEVLAGARQTIKLFRPKIFIEHSDNEVSVKDEITAFLDPYGYKFEVIGNNILAK
jgi:FkbM family methyltransferase